MNRPAKRTIRPALPTPSPTSCIVEPPVAWATPRVRGDFWRVTPSGLRIWMRGFEETALGFFTIYGCPIDTGVFYFGRKPKGNARDSTL
jgi:hypothetical protein